MEWATETLQAKKMARTRGEQTSKAGRTSRKKKSGENTDEKDVQKIVGKTKGRANFKAKGKANGSVDAFRLGR